MSARHKVFFARPKYLEQKGANVPLDLSPARNAHSKTLMLRIMILSLSRYRTFI
jgi:hypothetical protein